MCMSRWKEVVSLQSVWSVTSELHRGVTLSCYFYALLSGIHEACVGLVQL